MLEVMFWPIVACVLLPWLLVYLGLHVVQRGIIFVDIAMAQMASLGICVALLFRIDLAQLEHVRHRAWHSPLRARQFFLSPENAPARFRRKRSSELPTWWRRPRPCCSSVVPPKAMKKSNRCWSATFCWSLRAEVWKCFALFLAVGVFHFVLRRNFLLVSFDRDRAYRKGFARALVGFSSSTPLFGLVVTIFVRIAGVLLVFSYLIVPAVCGINLARGIRARLLFGWVIATIGGIGGLFWSFYGDLPSGAAIVCTFGGLLVLVSLVAMLRKRDLNQRRHPERSQGIP